VFLVNDQDVHVEMYEEKEVKFECSATSDPSTPPSVRWWYKAENKEEEPVQENPPTVTIKDGALTIFVNPNGTQKWENYHGEYRCVGDNGYSKATAAVKLIVDEYLPPGKKNIDIFRLLPFLWYHVIYCKPQFYTLSKYLL